MIMRAWKKEDVKENQHKIQVKQSENQSRECNENHSHDWNKNKNHEGKERAEKNGQDKDHKREPAHARREKERTKGKDKRARGKDSNANKAKKGEEEMEKEKEQEEVELDDGMPFVAHPKPPFQVWRRDEIVALMEESRHKADVERGEEKEQRRPKNKSLQPPPTINEPRKSSLSFEEAQSKPQTLGAGRAPSTQLAPSKVHTRSPSSARKSKVKHDKPNHDMEGDNIRKIRELRNIEAQNKLAPTKTSAQRHSSINGGHGIHDEHSEYSKHSSIRHSRHDRHTGIPGDHAIHGHHGIQGDHAIPGHHGIHGEHGEHDQKER